MPCLTLDDWDCHQFLVHDASLLSRPIEQAGLCLLQVCTFFPTPISVRLASPAEGSLTTDLLACVNFR